MAKELSNANMPRRKFLMGAGPSGVPTLRARWVTLRAARSGLGRLLGVDLPHVPRHAPACVAQHHRELAGLGIRGLDLEVCGR